MLSSITLLPLHPFDRSVYADGMRLAWENKVVALLALVGSAMSHAGHHDDDEIPIEKR